MASSSFVPTASPPPPPRRARNRGSGRRGRDRRSKVRQKRARKRTCRGIRGRRGRSRTRACLPSPPRRRVPHGRAPRARGRSRGQARRPYAGRSPRSRCRPSGRRRSRSRSARARTRARLGGLLRVDVEVHVGLRGRRRAGDEMNGGVPHRRPKRRAGSKDRSARPSRRPSATAGSTRPRRCAAPWPRSRTPWRSCGRDRSRGASARSRGGPCRAPSLP